jgi:sugar phosphate isomerase/epimerase
MSSIKLGIQNYTIRNELEVDFFGAIEKCREMGLRYCQISGGLYGHAPEEVRDRFSRMDMHAVAVHAGLEELENDFERVIEQATVLGYRLIVLPWVAKERLAQGWAKFAKEVEPIARKLKERGFQFNYHNHSFEFEREADGRIGLDVFYEETDPDLVFAEIDTYWVKHGGQDPAAYIRKVKGRTSLTHFKDMAQDGSMTECGEGILDWDGILAACRDVGVEYGVIELDECPHPTFESVRMCTEFFRSKGIAE